MTGFKRSNTLYLNTSFTLAFGLVCFTLLSALLVFIFILSPMAQRAADDLGGLMHILSKSWVALPANEKKAFQSHLRDQHYLFITDEKVPRVPIKTTIPFIPKLEKALHHHTGQKVTVTQSRDDENCFWVVIPLGNQTVKIGFLHNRIGPRPLKAIEGIIGAACLLIIIATGLMVRRITRPITTLSDAVRLLGSGQLSTRIPETGSEELVLLARNFNRMAEEISLLLTNRNLLFGGISHDLRTPITRMKLALELIENEENKDYISGMKQDLDEMDTMIRHTLELIRGMDKHQAVTITINELIDSMVSDYHRQGYIIETQNSECGTGQVEVNALRRVLCNLLDNAFRYGGNKPVKLSCSKVKNKLVIHIIDQGPGIPVDKIDAVFQPFYRLDNSRNKKTGGSGLGLAIVRQLCEIYDWKIRLIPGQNSGLEARLEIPTS